MSENPDAMPQGMETSRRYRDEREFARDVDRMTARGWIVERVRIGPVRRSRAARWLHRPARPGVADVHYLRPASQ